jgi:hypothetical protein
MLLSPSKDRYRYRPGITAIFVFHVVATKVCFQYADVMGNEPYLSHFAFAGLFGYCLLSGKPSATKAE